MELLLQDAAVTVIALGAAFVLFRRVHSAVTSSRQTSSSCGSCPNCESKRDQAINSQAQT